MSFSDEVKKEALSLPIKKTCCRKAFTLGLFMGAVANNEEHTYTSYFSDEEIAQCAKDLLSRVFRTESEVFKENKAGRITYGVKFFSPVISDFLRLTDAEDDRPIHILAGFRCENCTHAFLRGAFIATGSVTDPTKAYHGELTFQTMGRSLIIEKMLTARSGAPKKISRHGKFGIYYKNNDSIADMLYYIGCSRTGLAVANSWIEHDIRNRENRATNCVARNISISVGAAQKHITAIEKLIENGKIERLSAELRYTASLRIENDSATLSELAALHIPPITKSGLNGRLRKILEASEEC